MSRWLASVGNLLEKLDDQAEQVADEHAARQEEQQLEAAVGEGGDGTSGGLMDAYGGKLQDILAKRGLANVSSDDNDEQEGETAYAAVGSDNIEETLGIDEDPVDGGGREIVEEVSQQQLEKTQPQVQNLTVDDDFGDIADGWDETQNEEEDNLPIQVAMEAATTKESDDTTKEESSPAVEPMVEKVAPTASTDTINAEAGSTPIEATVPVTGTPKRVDKEWEANQNEKFYTPKQQVVEEVQILDQQKTVIAVEPAGVSATKFTDNPMKGDDTSVKPAPTPRPPPPKPKPPSETGSKLARATPAQSSDTKIPKPSKKAAPKQTPPRPTKIPKASSTASATPPVASSPVNKKELAEAQKEARTLRRHVVSLNAQLEAAETEMKAQRVELEQAGDRMEKDRLKNKQQLEQLKTKHKEELAAMKKQQQSSLKEAQEKFKNEVATYKSQMKDMESRRKQEGGDLNKELSSAMDREHEMMQDMTALRSVYLYHGGSTLLSWYRWLTAVCSILLFVDLLDTHAQLPIFSPHKQRRKVYSRIPNHNTAKSTGSTWFTIRIINTNCR